MTKEGLEAAIHTTETLVQIFGFIVAIGIVGEVGFGLRYFILNGKLQSLQHLEEQARQAEIARLNKEAGEARKSAADAHERAAGAEERAAEANKKAEEERLARTKIEEKLAPRHLTPQQQRQVATKLHPFATQIVDIVTQAGDSEVAGIGKDISAALETAGWQITTISGNAPRGDFSGILVEAQPNAGNVGDAAAALVSALTSERLFVLGPQPAGPQYLSGATVTGTFTIGGPKIIVTISKKP